MKPWLKFYKDTPHSLNYPEWTLYETIRESASKYPNNIAYSFLGLKSSYEKFLHDIDHVAAFLIEKGLKKGDKITICMPNVPSALIAFYAVNKMGALASMIHPLSTAKEIEYYLKESRSRWALTLDVFYPNFQEILDRSNVEKLIIATLPDYLSAVKGFLFKLTKGRKIKKIPSGDQRIIYWKDILSANIGNREFDTVSPDEAAVILFSGGTTGMPKGILLSSKNINALGLQTSVRGKMDAGDKMLSILPIFHGFGLAIGVHAVLMNGATSILIPKFDASTLAENIAKERPQFMAGVPTLYEALLREKRVQNVDFSCFKLMAAGGDSLPLATKKRFDEFILGRGAQKTLLEGYGLTESVTANCLMPDDIYKEGSVGIPFPDMELKIVKMGTSEELPYGEEGEICVHGPTVMLGYMNAPEENNRALQKHEDGRVWLHTGDLGKMDEEGFVYFSLRMKRLIKVSGMGVYPPEIEDSLTEHPDVALSCAIGIPDDYQMHKVKAFVVLKTDRDPEEVKTELFAKCKKELNRWSQPVEIEIRDSLPLTKIGKVDYTELEKEEQTKPIK